MPEDGDEPRPGADGESAGCGTGRSAGDGEPTTDRSDRAERIRAELAAGGNAGTDGDDDSRPSPEPELPDDALREAERLTRLARRAVDDAEAAASREERGEILGEHGFAATIREGDDGAVLVCHPEAWLGDDAGADAPAPNAGERNGSAGDGGNAIDPRNVDDVDRAREVPLEGAGSPAGWTDVSERNRAVARDVREAHGDVHGANADALATYASNHYAKPIAALTAAEIDRFREEYYPRNVWPSDAERAALDRSLELVYAALRVPMPDR